MRLGRVGARVAAARMGACAPRTKEQAVQGCPVVRTRCDARTVQFCVGTRLVFGAGGTACSAGEGMQARRGAGAMRVGQREVRRPRGRRYAAQRAVCARWTKGLPLARRHKLCDGHIPRCTKDKNIRTVGFEPTPSKRPVPETGALDRSARSASMLRDAS